MPGRTAAAARAAFEQTVQTAVSCFGVPVKVLSSEETDGKFGLRLHSIPLSISEVLDFNLRITYSTYQRENASAAERYAVHVEQYIYTVSKAGDIKDRIIAFHWHPTGEDAVPFPHLHVYEATPAAVVHGSRHVPTGRILLEGVITWLIDEFGATHAADARVKLEKQAETVRNYWRPHV